MKPEECTDWNYVQFRPLINQRDVTISPEYEHHTCINNITAAMEREDYANTMLDARLNDANYARVTDKLKPGKTYSVGLYPISNYDEPVAGLDCFLFLRDQGALMVGAQGLLYLLRNEPDLFPPTTIVSFDYEGGLLHQDYHALVPYVFNGTPLKKLLISQYYGPWSAPTMLLCVKEKK